MLVVVLLGAIEGKSPERGGGKVGLAEGSCDVRGFIFFSPKAPGDSAISSPFLSALFFFPRKSPSSWEVDSERTQARLAEERNCENKVGETCPALLLRLLRSSLRGWFSRGNGERGVLG